MGLYRDHGLRVFRNLSGPEIEKKRKEIIKAFKDCGLFIATKKMSVKSNFSRIFLKLLVKHLVNGY